MVSIDQFLRDRLDEDEAVAKAAIPKEWKGRRDIYLAGGAHRDQMRKDWVNATLANGFSEYVSDEATTAQVARHDPARVLREVEAKRRTMARHYADDDGSCVGCHFANDETRWSETIEECPELRDMASVYDAHPDYEQSWSTK